MSLRNRIGGLSLHVQQDSYSIAAKARAGLEQKFEREALATIEYESWLMVVPSQT